jgi:hypothetical protein
VHVASSIMHGDVHRSHSGPVMFWTLVNISIIIIVIERRESETIKKERSHPPSQKGGMCIVFRQGDKITYTIHTRDDASPRHRASIIDPARRALPEARRAITCITEERQ